MIKTENIHKPELVLEHFEIEKSNALKQMDEIIYIYPGTPEKIMVDEVASEIENEMIKRDAPKKCVKGFFSIVVEMMQNINIHGEKDAPLQQKSFAIIGANSQNYYYATTGNLIKEEFVKKTEAKLNYINSLTHEELKKYYLQVLSDGNMSHKGGAGLGLITLAIKSNNKIDYSFHKLDNEYSLLKLKTQINL